MLKTDLKIFLWAMLHSQNFKLCYFKLPVQTGFYWTRDGQDLVFRWCLRLRSLSIYIPYCVREEYFRHIGNYNPYDDIPF